MPSRADMDRPATVAAALLGVALIAVSLPFLGSSDEGPAAYAISWAQESHEARSAPNGAPNADAVVSVTVEGRHPSNATVTFEPCTDAGAGPLQQPATITWSLREGNNTLREGQQASCANNGPFTVPLHPHPDIGTAEGGNATAAAHDAESRAGSVTYTLTFRYSRPAAPGGLPLPPPAFATTGELEVQVWRAVANEPGQEGAR
jgi:hypothetical protein